MERHVIETQLSQLGVELDRAVTQLCELEETSVDVEADYKATYGKAFLSGSGSIEDRKQQAVLASDDLLRMSGKAKAAVQRQKEHIKALHARIDVGRTLASNVRTEASLTRTGLTP